KRGRAREQQRSEGAKRPLEPRRSGGAWIAATQTVRRSQVGHERASEHETRRGGADRRWESQHDADLQGDADRKAVEAAETPADVDADRQSDQVADHGEPQELARERLLRGPLMLSPEVERI